MAALPYIIILGGNTMFKFKRKTICAVLLVALMGTMAVGCGQKAEQPKQDEPQQQTEQQGEQPNAADKKEWVLAISII